MLSGEGNENGEETTIGLNSKEATLYVQQTFFVYFFAVVLHDYKVKSSRNFLVTRFMEEMSYVLFRSLFVFTAALFHPTSFSHRRYKISKKCPLVFYLSLELSVALFLVELRWSVPNFLLFSLFLFLYIPNLWT